MVRVRARADYGDFGLTRDGDTRHLGCRIGVSETAAGGAAIADLMMGDVGDSSGEERMRRAQRRIF